MQFLSQCAVLLTCIVSIAVAKPQEFDFNTLVDVSNPLVVQARPTIGVDRQGAAAAQVPVVVPAPGNGSEYF